MPLPPAAWLRVRVPALDLQIEARAVAAPMMSQEHCFLWLHLLPLCMTKAEWAAWAQAVGSILGLGLAVWIPWNQRRYENEAAEKRARALADLTIRYHSDLFVTNEEMLGVARAQLERVESDKIYVDLDPDVIRVIGELKAVDFEEIRLIQASSPDLARYLADFHCTLETLRGVLDRKRKSEKIEAETLRSYLDDLERITKQVWQLTVPR